MWQWHKGNQQWRTGRVSYWRATTSYAYRGGIETVGLGLGYIVLVVGGFCRPPDTEGVAVARGGPSIIVFKVKTIFHVENICFRVDGLVSVQQIHFVVAAVETAPVGTNVADRVVCREQLCKVVV